MNSRELKTKDNLLNLVWDSSAPDMRPYDEQGRRTPEGLRSLDEYFDFLEAFEDDSGSSPPVIVYKTAFYL